VLPLLALATLIEDEAKKDPHLLRAPDIAATRYPKHRVQTYA
jgi:hypothetical protein